MKLVLKNRKLVSILGILTILFSLSPVSAFAAAPMSDIAGHWAKDQIQSWVDSGYIKGYPDGTFKPENNITRAEFMTIANNAFGYTEKTEISFTDVKDGAWYEDAVAVAKAAGYITGYPDGTMKPNDPITRQEAAVMISKIDALTADEAAADGFTDGSAIPDWSKGAVGACVEAKIFNGYPNGSFLGENNIKRGESTVALSKALAYKNAPEAVAAKITEISAEGFQLNLAPAVDGLTQSAVTLTKVDSSATAEAINVTVSAITTADKGATYAVTADLEAGQSYKLKLTKEGYDFGTELTLAVLSDQQAADAVNTVITSLPAIEALTLTDENAVNQAKEKLNALTEAQTALVTAENKAKLEASIVKIAELKAAAQHAADQTAADAVTAKIAGLPAAAGLTLENKNAVNEAKAAFDALTAAQKALVSAENQTKLNDAVAKIASLEAAANEDENAGQNTNEGGGQEA